MLSHNLCCCHVVRSLRCVENAQARASGAFYRCVSSVVMFNASNVENAHAPGDMTLAPGTLNNIYIVPLYIYIVALR